MKDTRNIYVIEMANGSTFELDTPLENEVQLDYLIDNYYKG